MSDSKNFRTWKVIAICVIIGVFTLQTRRHWLPVVNKILQKNIKPADGEHTDHADHVTGDSIMLSEQAKKNIGLTADKVQSVKLSNFTKTMMIPAMVTERPGRTKIKVVAPMTGIVTNISIIAGETVQPGFPLFKIRLTHEDLVQAQTVFLKTLGELDVEQKEIVRLEKVTSQGAIARKVLIERIYQKDKLEAVLKAHREALLLHGFTDVEVNTIVDKRSLLSTHQVFAPHIHQPSGEVHAPHLGIQRVSAVENQNTVSQKPKGPVVRFEKLPLIVQELKVMKGQFVEAGDTLCLLVDFSTLYIEGRAFEQDAKSLLRSQQNKWDVQMMHEQHHKEVTMMSGLKIDYIENQIEINSRALHFFLSLPNQVLHNHLSHEGHRFITWRFKPGQRVRLRIPVEVWEDQIVLNNDAIVHEGADYFVFLENGNQFNRKPVHVLYQDQFQTVISNDGSIFLEDRVATTGAHQMQIAIKNASGGAVDQHVGHTH